MSQNFDKKEIRLIIKNLEKLGLTEKEAGIYIFLLGKEVEVGSSKIVLGTNLHGQYVYDALGKLEEKGLVKHFIKNGRKKWLANPPDRLSSLIEEKRIIANSVSDQLQLLFRRKHEQDFEIYQGEDQFVANEFQMIREADQNSQILIIGGKGDRFSQILGDENRRPYNAIGIEKNILVKYIGTEDQREYLTWVKSRRVNFEFRIMPGLHTSSVATSIHQNSVMFQVYGDPVLVFKLKSKQISNDYKTFFESLWSMCS